MTQAEIDDLKELVRATQISRQRLAGRVKQAANNIKRGCFSMAKSQLEDAIKDLEALRKLCHLRDD